LREISVNPQVDPEPGLKKSHGKTLMTWRAKPAMGIAPPPYGEIVVRPHKNLNHGIIIGSLCSD